MNVNVNFFTWIREGVKQAVLLGVSDAVEHIGVPDADGEKTGPFLESLQQNAMAIGVSKKEAQDPARRKRLGRSLKDMDEAAT